MPAQDWHEACPDCQRDGCQDTNRLEQGEACGRDMRKPADHLGMTCPSRYLEKSFKQKQNNFDTIEYKIGEIFGEIKNKIQSGYSLREIINIIDTLSFGNNKDKHELSSLYEDRIQNMGNTGRNGGEYYTPRPLIRTIIKTVQPKIEKTIYDGAVGSAGFLIEAYDYLKANNNLSTAQLETLQKHTLYGKEKKPLPYIIATMNTSDQSLFPMDSAFKRRWDTKYFPIDYADANKARLVLTPSESYPWGCVLQILNDYIKKETESANKTIGNRFIDFSRTENKIEYNTFRDKVLFFLFSDVFKDNVDFAKYFFGEKYENPYMFFEDLCEHDDVGIVRRFIKKLDKKDILNVTEPTQDQDEKVTTEQTE